MTFLFALITTSPIVAASAPAPSPAPAPAKKPEPAKPEPKPVEPPAKPAPSPAPEPKPTGKPEPKPAPTPTPAPAPAAEKPASTPPPATATKTTPPSTATKTKTVAEVTKDCKRVTGLFDAFIENTKGTAYVYVKKPQIGPEFIYFTHTVDGVVQAGMNRGRYGDELIFRINRFYDRLEFVQQNTAFYFDPQSPLSRASNANISLATLTSEPIIAEDDGGYLISAGNLFLRETMLQVKPGGDGGRSVLGRLSETKTKFRAIRGYPDNTVFTVEYVYDNPAASYSSKDDDGAEAVTDPRYVSVVVQHSLIRVPENDFKPRHDDPRVGYFATQVTDMTATEAAVPYRDVIHRWNLVKQKPGTALSEPVHPIVFWIENTTPLEFRDTIRKAALRWNEAFETAGFKDALVIKQQPDKADWDAGDINYNVLRWTSSPSPPFGGYGPSFVNPRTGEILGADIMLEFSYISGRLRSSRMFEAQGLANQDDDSGSQILKDPHQCLAGQCAQQGMLFGSAMLRLQSAPRVEMKAMLDEALHYLVLHELGHTLGLNHNFRGSQLHDPVKIHQKAITEKEGLMGSVMDYPPANIAPKGVPQGQFFTTGPGPYDHWAIEYGYSEAMEDPVKEEGRLTKIASRSHAHELAFANDADDMRRTGKGIDPRAMLFDMSSDPVTYGDARCQLVQEKLTALLKEYPKQGESWEPLSRAYVTLTSEASNALIAMSRYVGGLYVERAFVGQSPDTVPYRPVEPALQLRAIDVLAKWAFAPKALAAPPELLAHLQRQRRGFNFSKEDESPRLHDRTAKLQRTLLDHLLHPTMQERLVDSSLYGDAPPLQELMGRLTQAVFSGDPATGPDSVRQNLQTDYVDRQIRILNSGNMPSIINAVAFAQVQEIKRHLTADAAFAASPAHRDLLLYKIRRGLDEPK
ncbi:MAG: zinc-dependent metalloprotease [Verrucomicrobiaceae bacterium]|nr:zinc-dependent metalloprotease [Verrucomicrobiaceae bacterium]